MRSPRPPFVWLLVKEWRELLVARSWWLLLAAMGPLVGMSFISSVRTYAEVSGLGGTSGGVGEAMAPLIGVWAPTFSACELAAVFLLPFVAIRVVAGDRQSGALKLELQRGMSPFARIGAKALVLLAGWIAAMLPPLSALLLWKSYGGTLYAPELIALTAGHILNAGLTIALAAAMASLTEHPSTAAILTLGVTVGTWIVDFFAAIHGGIWEKMANYIPSAMVAQFQHGLVQTDTVLIAVILAVSGLSFAAIWMRLGIAVRRRTYESIGICLLAAVLIFGSSFVNVSWDASESRDNSFPEEDEEALRHVPKPLSMEVHLAQEDPRRNELERHALAKLRRAMSHLQIKYVASTSIGMFEEASPHYGEIWYQAGNKRVMSRVTSAEGVLEAIYDAEGLPQPSDTSEIVFRGHPLAVPPRGAGTMFDILWPAVVGGSALMIRRRLR